MVPGFIVISNPFEAGYQKYWIQRCLEDYPVKPNVTNLDAHMKIGEDFNIWQNSLHDNRPDMSKGSLLMKLRWTTLGFHYDWNTKEYYADKYTAFPEDLALLCQYVAAALHFPEFNAEAAIINYYHMDSTLAGHTDHSELDHEAPLISVSFGQDAIFLIGGATKSTSPIALRLHSGDICVMSGPSRLAYHAVPKILPSDPDYLHRCFNNPSTCEIHTEEYCRNSDIPNQNTECNTTKSTCNIDLANCSSVEQSDIGVNEIVDARWLAKTDFKGSDVALSCNTTNKMLHVKIPGQDGDTRQMSKESKSRGISLNTNERTHKSLEKLVQIGQKACLKCMKSFSSDNPSFCSCPEVNVDTCGHCQVNAEKIPNVDSGHFPDLTKPHASLADSSSKASVEQVNMKIEQVVSTLDWRPLEVYLKSSRINMNVRQVLCPGQTFLNTSCPTSNLEDNVEDSCEITCRKKIKC